MGPLPSKTRGTERSLRLNPTITLIFFLIFCEEIKRFVDASLINKRALHLMAVVEFSASNMSFY